MDTGNAAPISPFGRYKTFVTTISGKETWCSDHERGTDIAVVSQQDMMSKAPSPAGSRHATPCSWGGVQTWTLQVHGRNVDGLVLRNTGDPISETD